MQHLLQPIEIEKLVSNNCPVKPHRHSFFELVYILDGCGSYIINGYQYPYSKDDVFVIVPEHGHHTIVQETTSFVFIRFNSKFIQTGELSVKPGTDNPWFEKLEYIFANQQLLKRNLDQQTRKFLCLLCKTILQESSLGRATDEQLLHQLVRTMLMVIVKRIDLQTTSQPLPVRSSIRSIVDYIHRNIRNPDNLRIERIAGHVNMSKNYVSEYFKKFYSRGLQQYITDYKFRLIEDRLRRSDLRLAEIAFEFGFSGESHLATAFRKQRGISPIRYRKAIVKTS